MRLSLRIIPLTLKLVNPATGKIYTTVLSSPQAISPQLPVRIAVVNVRLSAAAPTADSFITVKRIINQATC